MTFSPLASRSVPNHNKYSSRDRAPVSYLIVHHWAGTAGGDARLLNPSEQVSASYILYGSGELVGQVPEEFRPWTSGSWSADAPAVTVETQNSDNGGDWPVSDAAVEMLARLAADLCTRHGWGRLDRNRVRGHREFASTACPGPYLWGRLDAIVARGNAILGGSAAATATATRKGHRLMFDLYMTGPTPKNTGVNIRLVTGYGSFHVPTTQLANLLIRRRNAMIDGVATMNVLELQGRMLDGEHVAINSFLKVCHGAASAGAEFDAAKFRSAMTDALRAMGDELTVTVDSEIDPEKLAAALEIATQRVLKKLAA